MKHATTCLLLLLSLGSAAAWSATVSRVDGEVVDIRDLPAARVGDTVEILTRLPGFDEAAKVGSGRVVSVTSGGVTARIDQRSGALAVGQEARLAPRSTEQKPAVGMPALPATPATAGAGAEVRLQQDIEEALRQGQLDRVTAIVGPNREVTLRGSVTSAADKSRALDIARRLSRTRTVKDQVFVVEP